MDLYATCLKLAGAPVPGDRPIDGLDLTPVLLGKGPSPRTLFFYYRGTQLFAARKGPHKAHFLTRPGYGGEEQKHDPPLLFDLRRDPSERFNVASNHLDVVADLTREVERHRATVAPVENQLEETLPEDKQ